MFKPSKSSGQYNIIIYYHHSWLIITFKGYSHIRTNKLTLIPGVTPVVVDAVSGYGMRMIRGDTDEAAPFAFLLPLAVSAAREH